MMEIEETNIEKAGKNNNSKDCLLSALLSISKNIENQHRDENNKNKNNNEEYAAQIVKNASREENEK